MLNFSQIANSPEYYLPALRPHNTHMTPTLYTGASDRTFDRTVTWHDNSSVRSPAKRRHSEHRSTQLRHSDVKGGAEIRRQGDARFGCSEKSSQDGFSLKLVKTVTALEVHENALNSRSCNVVEFRTSEPGPCIQLNSHKRS